MDVSETCHKYLLCLCGSCRKGLLWSAVVIYDSFLVLTKPYFVICNQKYYTYEKYYYYEFDRFFVQYLLYFV